MLWRRGRPFTIVPALPLRIHFVNSNICWSGFFESCILHRFANLTSWAYRIHGGEGGIRTLGGVTHSGFQDRCTKPLCDLSASCFSRSYRSCGTITPRKALLFPQTAYRYCFERTLWILSKRQRRSSSLGTLSIQIYSGFITLYHQEQKITKTAVL